jgi:hypothetical protein
LAHAGDNVNQTRTAFADLSRGFFRVFGQSKISVLLGFTIAAYNLDRVRSFKAKQAEDETTPVLRDKRRQGTWSDSITRDSDGVPAKATGPPDYQLSSPLSQSNFVLRGDFVASGTRKRFASSSKMPARRPAFWVLPGVADESVTHRRLQRWVS